jgi:hypothetical protein
MFAADLVGEWMKIPGALPHWAKEMVPGIADTTRRNLGDRLPRFLAALAAVDPGAERAFANPMLRSLLLSPREATVLRSAHGA